MLESDLLDAVLALAKVYGFRAVHWRAAKTAHGWRTPVQGDGKGWPDLLLVKGGRMIAAELKSDTGRLAPEQRLWLSVLEGAGVETYLWRPSDLQHIADVLSAKSDHTTSAVSTRRNPAPVGV